MTDMTLYSSKKPMHLHKYHSFFSLEKLHKMKNFLVFIINIHFTSLGNYMLFKRIIYIF